MVKIALIGLMTMFAGVVLGKMKPEYGICAAIAGCTLLFFLGIEKVSMILEELTVIQEYAGISKEYIQILLKMLGIAYIAEFSSALCKDAGQGAIAGQIDFVGKVSMIVLGIPILTSLLKTMGEFLS
ncbi:MAG: stage III sporulation protein AD [Lachnospiraceae bacterium]|nr:stage III sporulation protein AD [Lachnospiraceae bacterium]